MSIQNVIDFLARVASDPALKSKLERSPTVEAFIAAAKALGFDITAEDIANAKSAGNMPMSLSDVDLDAVVGGADQLPPKTQTSSCILNTQGGSPCTPKPLPPSAPPPQPIPDVPDPTPNPGSQKPKP